MTRLLAALLAVATWCLPAAAEEIRIEGGGTTLSSVFTTWAEAFQKETGITVNVAQTSAVAGLVALHEGRVDIAAAAHPLQDLVAAAAREGVTVDEARLVATPIEENRLLAIVHRANPVKALSMEQLAGLFTGSIRSWKEVGGPDLDVEVVWAVETKGQNQQFTRVVLGGAPVAGNVHEVRGYSSIVNLVRVLPGAIGIIPAGMNSPATRSPAIPEIGSPMFLITEGAAPPKVQRFIDFYLKESGFLR